MGGSMEMIGVASSQTSAWNVVVPAGYSGGLTTDSRCTLSGTLTGAGTLNLKIPFIRADFRGNWSAFTGTINILGNDFRVGNTYGYANATINLAESGANIYNLTSSGTIKIGALSGISSTYISGSVWEIGSNNADATFAGTIKGYSVNKVGTGTWTLTSPNNTYTSATNVNAGKLMVCNTSGIGAGTGTLTVASGATLGGSGIIKNNVVLNAGAILEPGNNGIGTLTDSTNLVLTNGSVTQIDIDNATKTADTIKVVGSLTLGGTLSINTIGTAIFALGDNFKLFNASSYSGSFSAIVPATPGPALAWDLSSLTTNGTLKVKAAISSLPGVVEAENYDFGVDGVAYHDETPDNSGGEYRTDNIDIVSCTDNGGGYNIQTGQANEWMNYSVNVTTSGVYQMKIRIRSGYAGAKLRVEVDGANATGSTESVYRKWHNSLK
jgi:autotransporter-associated beta strand protein